MISDHEGNVKHIGKEIKFSSHLQDLTCVENYFREQCVKRGFEVSFDCMAGENPNFKTLNYTTFAGMFICHPLQSELSFFQIQDAFYDNLNSLGHLSLVKSLHSNGKYEGLVLPFSKSGKYNVAVLTGGNKFNTLNWDKLSKVSEESTPLVVKPHPVSTLKDLDEVQKRLPNVTMAPRLSPLYPLLKGSAKVYTTHVSETAVTALLLGKKTEPIDFYPHCLLGSFSHITYNLFSKRMSLAQLDRAMASPKSGIIHPSVDMDWEHKVDAYLDYISQQKENHEGYK